MTDFSFHEQEISLNSDGQCLQPINLCPWMGNCFLRASIAVTHTQGSGLIRPAAVRSLRAAVPALSGKDYIQRFHPKAALLPQCCRVFFSLCHDCQRLGPPTLLTLTEIFQIKQT